MKKSRHTHKASGFGFDKIRTNVTEYKTPGELVNNILLQIDPQFFNNRPGPKKK